MLRKRHKDSGKAQIAENDESIKEIIESGKCSYDPFQMAHDHIRLLVYVEKSSRLRFDSHTIKFTENETTDKLSFFPQKEDTRKIGDLIFGEAQHMIESGSFKMHHVGDKLMISRLFSLPREKDIGSANYNLESDVRSAVQMWDMFIKKDTNIQRHFSYFNTEPPEYLRKVSRARMSTMSRVPLKSDRYSISYGSTRRPGSSLKGLNVFRYTALAIIFDKELEEFVYNYLHFIDREMKDLQTSIFDALCNDKKMFHYKTAVASRKFRETLIEFNNAMRLNFLISAALKNPFFKNDTVIDNFIHDFNQMINIFETKESGYFLSKLISAVMMYHLTWVLSTNEVYAGKQESFWTLSEYYQNHSKPLLNALGCIGALSHTTRIVIVGENVKYISQLLHILSYFIHIDHMPSNPAAIDSQREPNYSTNRLWPFSRAEFMTKLANSNQNPMVEFNLHDENLTKISDRWQLGEFGAMFAQKEKLRQQKTDDTWTTKYDLTDSDNMHTLRHRAKSEPQQLQSVTSLEQEEPSVSSFRPRSSSNPISRFKLPKKKVFKKPEKKEKLIVQTEFTTPDGKLPYGFTMPTQNKKDKNRRRIQKYEASAVWKEHPNRKLHDWKNSKNVNTERNSRSAYDSALPSTSSDYTPSDNSRPLSPLRTLMSPSQESLGEYSGGEQSTSSSSLLYQYDSLTSYKPIRAKRRKSITSLARALARNCVYIHDPANPVEEEDLYEQFFERLLQVEFTMDDFGDELNDYTGSARTAVIKKLLGGILDKFNPAFILQGINALKVSADKINENVKNEVQHPESFYITVPKENEKKKSVNPRKVLKTAGSEKKEVDYIQMTSVIIVANIEDKKITIHSGDVHTYLEEEMTYPCDIVQTMLENFRDMYADKQYTNISMVSALREKMESLVRRASQLHHFIQSLNTSDDNVFIDILNKVSNEAHVKLIKELMQRHYHAQSFDEKSEVITEDEKIDASLLIKLLNCQYSDLRLLINICSVLSPLVRAAMS
uniref:UDENN FNIP1/2-type domain-containing protein n=1 Tax=Panagrolaimus sp. ES5 TaxID=591445 RepID=A0AC34F8D4_9BILA